MAEIVDSSVSFDPLRQIRVLVLKNGEFDSPINASFKISPVDPSDASPDDAVEWEAVSYAWEGQQPSKTLHISEKSVKVSKLVLQMLKSLRHTDRKRFLWIDATCIDQENEVEKSQQVALMAKIYENAQAGII